MQALSRRDALKAFTRTSGLVVVLTSSLSLFYSVKVMDEMGILEKTYEVDHKVDSNSLEQGIDAYIIEEGGKLPQSLGTLESGTYEVCKQGLEKCPEGSISLDELVKEGYLKEIPSSYLSETENLTGYKLTYDSERYLIDVQNEDDAYVVSEVDSKGTQIISDTTSFGSNTLVDYNIIIEKGAVVTMSGKYKLASIVNYGQIIVEPISDNTKTDLDIIANEIINLGTITADYIPEAGLKFTAVNNFVNSGNINVKNKNEQLAGGNIQIVADNIQLAEQSINGASANGRHGNLDLIFVEYTGPELTRSNFFLNNLKAAKIVE